MIDPLYEILKTDNRGERLSLIGEASSIVSGFGCKGLRIIRRSKGNIESLPISSDEIGKYLIRISQPNCSKYLFRTKHVSKMLDNSTEAELYINQLFPKGIDFILHPYSLKTHEDGNFDQKLSSFKKELFLPKRKKEIPRRVTTAGIVSCQRDSKSDLNLDFDKVRGYIPRSFESPKCNSPIIRSRLRTASKTVKTMKSSQSYVKLKLNTRDMQNEEMVDQLISRKNPNVKHIKYKDWKNRVEANQKYPYDDLFASLITKHKHEVKEKSDAAISTLRDMKYQMQSLIDVNSLTPNYILTKALKHAWLRENDDLKVKPINTETENKAETPSRNIFKQFVQTRLSQQVEAGCRWFDSMSPK